MLTKKEIKIAKDNKLIIDYVRSYSSLCLNINWNMGTKRLSSHVHDLENELVARGILTEEDVEYMNM